MWAKKYANTQKTFIFTKRRFFLYLLCHVFAGCLVVTNACPRSQKQHLFISRYFSPEFRTLIFIINLCKPLKGLENKMAEGICFQIVAVKFEIHKNEGLWNRSSNFGANSSFFAKKWTNEQFTHSLVFSERPELTIAHSCLLTSLRRNERIFCFLKKL